MKVSADVLAKSIEESHSDPIAVTELATILAKAWCCKWGGWPEESDERMAQVWAHRPAARKLLDAMVSVSKTDRQALARRIAR